MSTSLSTDDARGADTRARLIEAGQTLFGRRSFEDVTTRQLAAAAGVNLAAIPYHFGSKENVYRSVAAHIAEHIAQEVGAALGAVRALLDEDGTGEGELLDGLHRFITVFAHEVLGAEGSAARAGFILREQLTPSAAFDILYAGFMGEAHRTLTELVARILGEPAESPQMIVRAHAIVGQVLGFRMARECLLRRLQVRELDVAGIGEAVADLAVDNLRCEAAQGGQNP